MVSLAANMAIRVYTAIFMLRLLQHRLNRDRAHSAWSFDSGVNFATLGYGDIVMSERWRLLGPLEASSGVLMFGLSASMLFAVMSLLFRHSHPLPPSKHQSPDPQETKQA